MCMPPSVPLLCREQLGAAARGRSQRLGQPGHLALRRLDLAAVAPDAGAGGNLATADEQPTPVAGPLAPNGANAIADESSRNNANGRACRGVHWASRACDIGINLHWCCCRWRRCWRRCVHSHGVRP